MVDRHLSIEAAVMPKSTPEELANLRDQVIFVARGRCEWPGCSEAGEEMAHLRHRGMGGSREANRLDNVVWLCRLHHDVLDGRTGESTRRRELAAAFGESAMRRYEINEWLRADVAEKRRRGR